MQSLVKNHPVKHTVDQVTQGTRVNQSGTDNKSFTVFLLYNPAQVPGTKYHGSQSEKRQNHFAGFVTEFPAPGHTRVFNKMQTKPVHPEYPNNFSGGVRGFDPDLQGLVGNDNKSNKESD